MKTALRVFLAFLAAVVAPAVPILLPSAIGIVIAGSYGDADVWVPFTHLLSLILMTSFLYVLVLGVPAFLLLRWRNAIRWWSVPSAGFVLACLPVAIDLWPSHEPDLQTTSSHWDGEKMVETMVNGAPTLAGWLSFAKTVLLFGAFGAVAGLAFWLVWWGMRSYKPLQATREDARA
jgi:hypothetical protein